MIYLDEIGHFFVDDRLGVEVDNHVLSFLKKLLMVHLIHKSHQPRPKTEKDVNTSRFLERNI